MTHTRNLSSSSGTLSDRFRRWYDYERDCNAKTLAMLESVPLANRNTPEFQRAVDLMAHLMVSRRMWLYRLGCWPENPGGWFPEGTALTDLPEMLTATEAAWTRYLHDLTDRDLDAAFHWQGIDGNPYRWRVEYALTQVFGHAWYHRGQIALLVDRQGGETVDTDYFFWTPPQRTDFPESGTSAG